jgi:hypothetical protein
VKFPEVISEKAAATNSSGRTVGEVEAASLPLYHPTSGSPAAPLFFQEKEIGAYWEGRFSTAQGACKAPVLVSRGHGLS